MSGIWRVRVAMVLLGVLIVMRPGIGGAGDEGDAPGADLDVVMVVDQTVSMSALDHEGVRSRLEGVREDMADIAEALPDARIALVTFGREAQVDLPFTTDQQAVADAIEQIAREPLLAGTGSTMSRPLDLVRGMLRRAAEQHPERRQVVVFASDGENTARTEEQQSFAPLERYVEGGAVLGYGTPGGARMPTGGEPPWTFVRDTATGADAISRLDEENLRRIAEQLGVDYTRRGNAESLSGWARGLSRGASGGGDGDDGMEVYWILAALLALVAALELRYDVLAWREAREAVSA
jgi:Ca-activated chloride channel family protein